MILINPRSNKFGVFERYVPLTVPIGIGYLAGQLLFSGKKVGIIDEHVTPVSAESLKASVKDFSPPYIFGISVLTACVGRSFEIARLIKGIFPESKVIAGGIHPTVLPEEFLRNHDFDFVVRQEAEEVVNSLYDTLKAGKEYSVLAGISFRSGQKIVHNPDGRLTDLANAPPFPFHLFEQSRGKYNFGFVSSSRGCPYECIFCSQRAISGQSYRYFPVEKVIEEIDLLINKYGQRHINFLDDNFTVNRKRVSQLLEMMVKREFYRSSTFDCQTRPDGIDDDVLFLLKKAGFRLINFGLETASERLMALLNKKETVSKNIEGVRLAKKHGFGVSATFIFGLPGETGADRKLAYKLAKDLSLDYARFNSATPYPGTKLYEIARIENRLFIDKDWSNLNACAMLAGAGRSAERLPYVPLTCDEAVLKKDIVKANLLFSLRPARIFKLLSKRIGPAGWFYLPPKWYLKPGQWFYLFSLGFRLIKSLLKSLF